MLASRALKRQTHHPKPGNLVFFGDGHVTLYYWRHVVLQAPVPGESVQLTRWYPGSDWVPTGYYKIRDAGNGPMRGLAKWVHSMITRYHLKIHTTPRCRTGSRAGSRYTMITDDYHARNPRDRP